MSSQTIAAPARGLPDFTPWPATDSNLHRDNDSDSNHHPDIDHQPSHSPVSSRPSWSDMDVQQRNQAVGNLLAALQTQPQTAPTPAEQDSPPLPDLPIEPLDDFDDGAGAMAAVLDEPNLDFTAIKPHPFPQSQESTVLDATALLPLTDPLPMDMLDEIPISLEIDDNAPAPFEATPPPPAFNMPSPERKDKRQVEAFAKLEFEDGNYYITTVACELGRDAFAYKAAIAKEEAINAGHDHGRSSSGRSARRSARSQGIAMQADSQVQGSVVSEAGGFGGVDDDPIAARANDDNGNPLHSHSSGMSAGSIVRPQEVLYHPPPAPFDYHKTAERQADAESKRKPHEPEDEEPAPVTEDHLPDANRCPLIPIHATQNEELSAVACHRNISRRHVRIEWSDGTQCFEMSVLGKNGAFLDDRWCRKGQSRKLRDGSKIQISGVEMTFRLPLEERRSSPSDESSGENLDQSPPLRPRSTSPTSDEGDRSISPIRPAPGKGKTKMMQKAGISAPPPVAQPPSMPERALGPDGQPLPPKRRGPGRPPKDGIMSTRERKEMERSARLAQAKAANGGVTPPPMRGIKPSKPALKDEDPVTDLKIEKRKYKKRKREGEDGEIMQSIEGEMELPAEPEKPPPAKKARSKSPSPDYPPAEHWTEEQLARPADPYARLIYDILLDLHPKALPLKQIYRALKVKFPFFVHRVDSEGWQSSVRHNLNQEWNKLFEKGEKEGKGFAWKAIPGALQPQAERRRATQQAASSKPKPTPAARQNIPQGPPQQLNWQNSTTFAQNGMPPQGHLPPFYGQGYGGPVPPPLNSMPWPPPPPGTFASPASSDPKGKGAAWGPNSQPFYPPPQAGPHSQLAPPQNGLAFNQGPYPPPATGSSAMPTASMPSSTSASRNMPCTTDGLVAIKRFENSMLKVVHPSGEERWRRIFASARHRLLHGHTQSLLPGGENEEEAEITKHLHGFIERFRNPNFVGFSVSTGSPAPAQNISKCSTPQPSLSANTKVVTGILQPIPSAKVPGPSGSPQISSSASGTADSKLAAQKSNFSSTPAGEKIEAVERSLVTLPATTNTPA